MPALIKTNQLSRLSDVSITNIQNGDILVYNSSNRRWIRSPQGGVILPSSFTLTRNGEGEITEINYTNGRNITINRSSSVITSVEDSSRGTFTINRDINGLITGVTFTSN